MLYTSPKFEPEEAARSQVESLQNGQRWRSGHAVGGPRWHVNKFCERVSSGANLALSNGRL